MSAGESQNCLLLWSNPKVAPVQVWVALEQETFWPSPEKTTCSFPYRVSGKNRNSGFVQGNPKTGSPTFLFCRRFAFTLKKTSLLFLSVGLAYLTTKFWTPTPAPQTIYQIHFLCVFQTKSGFAKFWCLWPL